METAGIVVCSPYGMTCTECNELVIAPRSSAHVSNHEVRHFWSCENCGHEIEVRVNLRIDAVCRDQTRALDRRSSHSHSSPLGATSKKVI
jgi:RNase P subunit RPR2